MLSYMFSGSAVGCKHHQINECAACICSVVLAPLSAELKLAVLFQPTRTVTADRAMLKP